jgi:hypothetical protein
VLRSTISPAFVLLLPPCNIKLPAALGVLLPPKFFDLSEQALDLGIIDVGSLKTQLLGLIG